MKLEDVTDGMRVRITSGGEDHPLHGARAEVILVTGPLPPDPPRSLQDPCMAQRAHLINSNLDGPAERAARAYRKDSLEAPFAWPHGRVHLSLEGREPASRRTWPFPYVVVSPADIEPA